MYHFGAAKVINPPRVDEEVADLRLMFPVPKSEKNLISSTIFENEGSKESGKQPAIEGPIPTFK
jgi:hypothetical protein